MVEEQIDGNLGITQCLHQIIGNRIAAFRVYPQATGSFQQCLSIPADLTGIQRGITQNDHVQKVLLGPGQPLFPVTGTA